MRYELAEYEWVAIQPMLPNKPRGVPRVNDRRVPNGIFWVLRSGAQVSSRLFATCCAGQRFVGHGLTPGCIQFESIAVVSNFNRIRFKYRFNFPKL
jgi:hypothetical protein